MQSLLARQATAALLSAANDDITYSMTENEVINAVQEAIGTNDRDEVEEQKEEFDVWDDLDCPIDAQTGEREDN